MSCYAEIWAWLAAYLGTQFVEVPIYLRATGGRWAESWLASTWTHPLVWFVFPALIPPGWGYWGMVAASETFAVVVEAIWLASRGVRSAWLWSLGANGASLILGLLARQTLGFP